MLFSVLRSNGLSAVLLQKDASAFVQRAIDRQSWELLELQVEALKRQRLLKSAAGGCCIGPLISTCSALQDSQLAMLKQLVTAGARTAHPGTFPLCEVHAGRLTVLKCVMQ